MREKHVQIPEDLFLLILNYFTFYDDFTDEAKENMKIDILRGLGMKHSAMIKREMYEKNLKSE